MPTVLEHHHFPLYSVHGDIFSKASAMPLAHCADSHMAADIMLRLNRDAQMQKGTPDVAALPLCSYCAAGVPRLHNPARGWVHQLSTDPTRTETVLCTRDSPQTPATTPTTKEE